MRVLISDSERGYTNYQHWDRSIANQGLDLLYEDKTFGEGWRSLMEIYIVSNEVISEKG